MAVGAQQQMTALNVAAALRLRHSVHGGRLKSQLLYR